MLFFDIFAEKGRDYGRIEFGKISVRDDNDVPFLFRAIIDWSRFARFDHGNVVCRQEQRNLQTDGKVLGKVFSD